MTLDIGSLLAVDSRVLAVVLFPFMSLVDLGNFDVAMTNHALRPCLFAIYPFLCIDHLQRGLDKIQMIWLFSRSIRLKSISFASDLAKTDLSFILRRLNKCDTSLVRHVDVSRGKHTTDAQFSQLFNACTQFETLNLAGCMNISKDNIHQLSALCMKLRSLDLTDCDLIKTVGALAAGFPYLTNLNLSRSSPRGPGSGNNMLKEPAVKALSMGCPGLVSLDITNCDNTRDGAMIMLCKNFPALTSLNMTGCDKITDSSIRVVSQICSALTRIELGVGPDCGGKVTDSSVISLSRTCTALACVGVSRCYNLTDAAAIVLGRGCPQLTSLDFSFCNRISNEGVIALSRCCPSLTNLQLDKCTKVTGVAVTALSQGCPRLQSLSLHSCAKISDSSLIDLAENCKSLASLDISFCDRITDVSIIGLANNCSFLSALWMVGCDKVTDVALVALILGCPCLKHVNFVGIRDLVARLQQADGKYGNMQASSTPIHKSS